MDFFAAQDKAHKQTGRLVGLLIAGLITMTVAVYFATMLVIHIVGIWARQQVDQAGPGDRYGNQPSEVVQWLADEIMWWDGHVALAVLGFMIILSGGGFMYRLAQLRGGGEAIAEMLGGRRIDQDTRDKDERRALNVVEEMSIASGMPVPPVYMMPSDAINAFAAGHTVDQAVIGLTKGCVKQLSRDQLQGVVAHEFSHVFNGDMRLNVRLIAVINGVMVLGVVGFLLWRTVGYAFLFGGGRSSDYNKNGGPAIGLGIMAFGIMLCVIGFVGTLAARLIQAAVSRQREFLADASAVQFTRNPDGIGNALRAIGATPSQTKLATETSQFNHMFFNQAMPSVFASHPPLRERIARIEGINIDDVGELKLTKAEASKRWAEGRAKKKADLAQAKAARAKDPLAAIPGLGGVGGGLIGAVAMTGLAGSLGQVGQIGAIDMAWTTEVLSHIPDAIRKALQSPHQVPGVVLAMLVHEQGSDAKAVAKQMQAIEQGLGKAVSSQVHSLLPEFNELDDRCRVPVLDLASPALAKLSTSQADAFRSAVEQLVMADGAVTRFEWVAALLVDSALDRGGDASHKPTAGIVDVGTSVVQLLSVVAKAGHGDGDEAMDALQSACAVLKLRAPTSIEPISLKALNAAVHDLRTLKFAERGRLLQATVNVVEHDGLTTVAEAEMVRAVAEMLAVPMPPVVPDAA